MTLARKQIKPKPGATWKQLKRVKFERVIVRRRRIGARVDPKLVKWSADVRERDLQTCQKPDCEFCHNVEGQGTIAHHVSPRSRRPDLRLDRTNGITLCPKAHTWCHFTDPLEATRLGLLSDSTYEAAMKMEAA